MRERRARKALWKEVRRIAEADLALVAEEIRALESEAESEAETRGARHSAAR